MKKTITFTKKQQPKKKIVLTKKSQSKKVSGRVV